MTDHTQRRPLRAGLAAALLAACTPSVEDYPDALERAICEWQYACHQYASVDQCVEVNLIEREVDLDYLLRAMVAGTVAYDRDAADACLDAYAALGCEPYDGVPPEACDGVFVGRVGRNEPCLISAECAGDAVCGFDPRCTDMCCPGACRVFAAPIAEGEPCGFGGAGCEEGLYCALDDNFNPTVCEKRVAVGESCERGEACVLEAVCDGSECRAFAIREADESCDGQFDRCVEGTDCIYIDGGQRCVGPVPLGGVCDPSGGLRCGRVDTYCDSGTGLCTLLPGPGAECADGNCASYANCHVRVDVGEGNQYVGTCVSLAQAGEACGSDDEGNYVPCLGALQCDGEVCVLPEPDPPRACDPPGAD